MRINVGFPLYVLVYCTKGSFLIIIILVCIHMTSQNTMYCGGEPEHKRVANKCMREEIHAHNNGASYIELHTRNKRTCHESSSLAVRLFTNHRC